MKYLKSVPFRLVMLMAFFVMIPVVPLVILFGKAGYSRGIK